MSEASKSCSGSCSSCGEECSSRKQSPSDFIEKLNENSKVKKVIGIVSGKGGVGKSLVTGLLASKMAKQGAHTAVLDADITGPSIPKIFGIKDRAVSCEFGIIPSKTKNGTDLMSINLMLENPSDPVIWRGPVIAGVVKQFWTDVIWDDVDYMFVDMPPGTGDVPLTVFQSLPVDGIIIVTSPQELVSMIVGKAVKMAAMMNIPVIGIVENMAYLKCPCCGEIINFYGESHTEQIALENRIAFLGEIPIDPAIAAACDNGDIESVDGDWLDTAITAIRALPSRKI